MLTHPGRMATAFDRTQGKQWPSQGLQAWHQDLRKARVSLEQQMEPPQILPA